MNDLISRQAAIDALCDNCDDVKAVCAHYPCKRYTSIDELPAADVVPWEFLERYADWFCALVSYPEFIREAKGFYESTIRAMDGGTIGEQEGDDDV